LRRVPPRWYCFAVVESCVTIEGIQGAFPIDRAVRSGWIAMLWLVVQRMVAFRVPGCLLNFGGGNLGLVEQHELVGHF
jgi:hypothetical protein